MPNDNFNYTYSAPEQEEIKNIRDKYVPKSETASKLERLRYLDKSVSNQATIAALTIGIVGTLIMGLGMSLTMVWTSTLFVPGILIGLMGIAILVMAYPVYRKTYQRRRDQVTPEILKLAADLEK